jgi:formamidopyrimidine-DNA glycosylase
MPELPEVETIKNQLSPIVLNKTIISSIAHSPKLRYDIELPPSNCTIISIKRRSKYIICECFENNSKKTGYWLIHLGMTGHFEYAYYNNMLERKKHTHVEINFADGVLRYIDTRRFGLMLYSYDKNHKLLTKLGPEPLEISRLELGLHLYSQSKIKFKTQSIKVFLANNEIVVGIGNIYASEILFSSHIHPQKLAKDISLQQYEIIARHAQNILKQAIAAGGSTIDNFTHLHTNNLDDVNKDNNNGYFQISHNVYGRHTQPCNVCNTNVEKIVQAQRSSFFCPFCQPCQSQK